MTDSKKFVYTGTDVEITYDVARCLHAEECVHGSRSVFDPDRKPWVDPDGASPDEIAAVIHRCPTGALEVRRLDSPSEENLTERTTVRVTADGPLYAKGSLRVKIPGAAEPQRETRVAFCRCGASSSKPFCDNAHEDAEFKDLCRVDLARALPGDPPEDAVGPAEEALSGGEPRSGDAELVDVTPVADGPLRFEGLIELHGSEEDGPSGRFEGAYLCRCGVSMNKPFCDGSHRAIEFKAEGF